MSPNLQFVFAILCLLLLVAAAAISIGAVYVLGWWGVAVAGLVDVVVGALVWALVQDIQNPDDVSGVLFP